MKTPDPAPPDKQPDAQEVSEAIERLEDFLLNEILVTQYGKDVRVILDANMTAAAATEKLAREVEELKGQLSMVDNVLSRRPALADFSNRVAKISHAIATAAMCDLAEQQLEQARKDTERLDWLEEVGCEGLPGWILKLEQKHNTGMNARAAIDAARTSAADGRTSQKQGRRMLSLPARRG